MERSIIPLGYKAVVVKKLCSYLGDNEYQALRHGSCQMQCHIRVKIIFWFWNWFALGILDMVMAPCRHLDTSTQLGSCLLSAAQLRCFHQPAKLCPCTCHVATCLVAKLSQPVPSSHGKCQCHLHMSQTSSPQAVVLLTPAWRCFVSAQAGRSGLQLNLSHLYQCLWFYH